MRAPSRAAVLLVTLVVLGAGAQAGGDGADDVGDDVAELKLLLAQAQRERVRSLLEAEIARLGAGAVAANLDAAEAPPEQGVDPLCASGGEHEEDELPHLGTYMCDGSPTPRRTGV